MLLRLVSNYNNTFFNWYYDIEFFSLVNRNNSIKIMIVKAFAIITKQTNKRYNSLNR